MESLKAKLHLAESSAKSMETLATERAHQISSLERECKVREDRLAAMEETLRGKDVKMSEVEAKMAASAEKVATLQIEKERLSQQVSSHLVFIFLIYTLSQVIIPFPVHYSNHFYSITPSLHLIPVPYNITHPIPSLIIPFPFHAD